MTGVQVLQQALLFLLARSQNWTAHIRPRLYILYFERKLYDCQNIFNQPSLHGV